MKVAGQAQLHAPIDKVWAALNDPAVLVRTIPGCERLEATGPDAYAMTVTAGVASIKGTYAGKVALSDQQEPSSFVMNASGAGGPGTVSAAVTVTLTEADGATTLSYDADAVVGGVIGGVGQRMLTGVAKKLAAEFFGNVDDVLTGKQPAPIPAVSAVSTASPVSTAPGSTGGGASADAVFLAPATGSRAGMIGNGNGFLIGTVLGAAIALLGVLVGSRRSR